MNLRYFLRCMVVGTLVLAIGLTQSPALARGTRAAPDDAPLAPTADAPIIVDHTSTDITAIPRQWIEAAKADLHIAYGHTSHGSQLTTGMNGLVGFANGGGLGLDFPENFLEWNNDGSDGALHLHDRAMGGDVGYYPQWVENTRDYLGDPNDQGRGSDHPEINVIIWSWCGQASGRSEQEMIDTYLDPMTQLEADYPGVTFVYMTGHADGSGEEGNLHQRNQQIRDYVIANNKVLYDFYDIELYDPDGNYYGDKDVNDNCDYDSDGNGSLDANWATEWQNAHTEDKEWYSCSCAHSQSLNCNQKAYATWWLWARLAGWHSVTGIEAQKMASTEVAAQDDVVTYTLTFGADAPLTSTVNVTDVIPSGLSYVAGSLAGTSGTADDSAAPTLSWTGTLTPTPAVTLTYAARVVTDTHAIITNTATFAAEGGNPLTRQAAITINRPADLSDSTKSVAPESTHLGETVTYTLALHNATGPLDIDVALTDTLPFGLRYVPETFTATAGTVDDGAAPTLTWAGSLSPTSDITLTYVAVVTVPFESTIILPVTLVNTATVVAEGYPAYELVAELSVTPPLSRIYLPLILR